MWNSQQGEVERGSENKFLEHLGWSAFFQTHLDALQANKTTAARIVGVRKNSFVVAQAEGEWLATVSGSIMYQGDVYPVAGDWVLTRDTLITRVLPRRNALSRGASGTRGAQDGLARQEQVIASNLDFVFIVSGLDRDFNVRRIERYLTLIYNCGLSPVVVLTKADMHSEVGPFVSEVEEVAFGVPVHVVSAEDDSGMTELRTYLGMGKTVTMVGSSGAGKSTLVNRMAGKIVQLTGEVSRSVGKGRHTTTTRDLIMLPDGGMIIDNPGIREIAFWDSQVGMGSAFPEIDELARGCRFSDCSHCHEPGCQVLEGVANGSVSQARLDSYHKMKRELDYLALRQGHSANHVEKQRWKGVSMRVKALKKDMKKR